MLKMISMHPLTNCFTQMLNLFAAQERTSAFFLLLFYFMIILGYKKEMKYATGSTELGIAEDIQTKISP